MYSKRTLALVEAAKAIAEMPTKGAVKAQYERSCGRDESVELPVAKRKAVRVETDGDIPDPHYDQHMKAVAAEADPFFGGNNNIIDSNSNYYYHENSRSQNCEIPYPMNHHDKSVELPAKRQLFAEEDESDHGLNPDESTIFQEETFDQTDPFGSDDSIADPNYNETSTSSEWSSSDEEPLSRKDTHVKNRSLVGAVPTGTPVEFHNETIVKNQILFNAAMPRVKRGSKGRTRGAREERKKSRNTGKAYITESGKNVRGKTFTKLNKCRNRCQIKISEDTQKALFEKYWKFGSRDKRAVFLSSLVTFSTPKVRRKRTDTPEKQKNRQVTMSYHVPVNGKQIKVCKKCFLKIFDETPKFLWVICNQKKSSCANVATPDKRGRHSPPNKIPENKLQEVRQHLNSLPCYESHYCRKETAKKYLPPHFTLIKAYKMYCETVQNPVSYTKYETLFHDLKLAIKSPHKDTCQACDKFKMQLAHVTGDGDKELILKQQELHHLEAELAYETKKKDKLRAKTEESLNVMAFYLQQCLPTPSLETSVVFYKRQLWTFNLTVHEMKNDKATCFIWYESVAKRGANEIASCVFEAVKELPDNVKSLILYSDTCPGQNKNSIFLAMCIRIINQTGIEVLDHKFMVSGHSRMECDSDHAQIEKFKKHHDTPISHPHDWIQLIRHSRKTNPFLVKEMNQTSFYNYANLLKTDLNMSKSNENKEKFVWKDVKWLRYVKDQPLKVLYKKSLKEEEDFSILDVSRRSRDFPQLSPSLTYKSPVPITEEKKRDLISLLPYIPPVFHDFYKNLTTTKSAVTDPILESDSD